MTDEQRQEALRTMTRVPREVKRAYRSAQAAVGHVDGLLIDCRKRPDDFGLLVSCGDLRAVLRDIELVRDKLSVISQQMVIITSFLGDPEAWERINGEVKNDKSQQ